MRIETGNRYGRLVVIRDSLLRVSKRIIWTCICACGEKTNVSGSHLRNGNTKSCGCLQKEIAAITGKQNRTHGKYGTRTYESWHAMKRRCSPSATGEIRQRYFDRGIRVSSQWGNFEKFLEDMGERPEGLTLDRIDNDGNYEPSNCRWATPSQQSQNQRSNKLSEHSVLEIKSFLQNGNMIQKEIATHFGVSETVVSRIKSGTRWANVSEEKN